MMNQEPTDATIEAHFADLLTWAGEFQRPGLERTPERAREAWQLLMSGYGADVDKLIELMPSEGNQVVTVGPLDFCSICEHHLLPFWGTAMIVYKPKAHLLGLSKPARVLDAFAHRVQIQERLTRQVAEALRARLQPEWVEVQTEAVHLCMSARGVMQVGAKTLVVHRV